MVAAENTCSDIMRSLEKLAFSVTLFSHRQFTNSSIYKKHPQNKRYKKCDKKNDLEKLKCRVSQSETRLAKRDERGFELLKDAVRFLNQCQNEIFLKKLAIRTICTSRSLFISSRVFFISRRK